MNQDEGSYQHYRTVLEQPTRCLVCKHGSHVTAIPNADWPGVKSKQLTATPCEVLVAHGKRALGSGCTIHI